MYVNRVNIRILSRVDIGSRGNIYLAFHHISVSNISRARKKNKDGYTATSAACRWAGAVMKKANQVFGHEHRAVMPKTTQKRRKSKMLPRDRPTDGPTDRVGCRVACTRLKTYFLGSVSASMAKVDTSHLL